MAVAPVAPFRRARPGTPRQRSRATADLYDADRVRFGEWCSARGVPSVPAAPEVVADYLRALADGRATSSAGSRKEKKGIASVERALTSISTKNEEVGSFGLRRTPPIRDVLAELRHRLAPSRLCAPLSFADLKEAVGPAPDGFRPDRWSKEEQRLFVRRRDRALLLFAFLGALRSSDLAQLDRSDVEYRGNHLLLHIGARDPVAIERLGGDDRFFCPVEAFLDLRSSRGEEDGPLFVAYDPRCYGRRLTRAAVDRVFGRALHAANLRTRVTPRSIRLGVAAEKLRDGAPTDEILSITGPRSFAALVRS